MKKLGIEAKLWLIVVIIIAAGLLASEAFGQQNITKRTVTLDSLSSRGHGTIWITNGIGGKIPLVISNDTLFFNKIRVDTLSFDNAVIDTFFTDEIVVRDTALIDFVIEHGGTTSNYLPLNITNNEIVNIPGSLRFEMNGDNQSARLEFREIDAYSYPRVTLTSYDNNNYLTSGLYSRFHQYYGGHSLWGIGPGNNKSYLSLSRNKLSFNLRSLNEPNDTYFKVDTNLVYLKKALRLGYSDNTNLTAADTGSVRYRLGNIELWEGTNWNIVGGGQLTGSLTDGMPTASEINTITALTPATATAGYKVTIKDSNGTGLLYKVESDGTDWYYTVMTKAL